MARLTALMIIGFAALGVIHGWNVLQFVYADTQARVDGSGVGVPGVTTPAGDGIPAESAAATGADAAHRQDERLTEYLAARPLSPTKWLSLAGIRLATKQRPGEALAALAMSSISGPNEADVMCQRVVFGLLEWEVLPAEVRQQIVADLSGIIASGALDDHELNELQSVASSRPPDTRAQVVAMLRADGFPAASLARIGL